MLGKEHKSSLFRAHVENMCCLLNATGQTMLETGRRQAENFGSRFLDADILKIVQDKAAFELETETSTRIRCRALILATGSARNTLKVKGEKEMIGKGAIHRSAAVKAISGDDQVQRVVLNDGRTISATGVFIELGAKGLMELATALGVALDDEMRFVRTDKGQRTSVPGIFAAGDICGPPWQVAKAVGEGCVAGINAADYVKKTQVRS